MKGWLSRVTLPQPHLAQPIPADTVTAAAVPLVSTYHVPDMSTSHCFGVKETLLPRVSSHLMQFLLFLLAAREA